MPLYSQAYPRFGQEKKIPIRIRSVRNAKEPHRCTASHAAASEPRAGADAQTPSFSVSAPFLPQFLCLSTPPPPSSPSSASPRRRRPPLHPLPLHAVAAILSIPGPYPTHAGAALPLQARPAAAKLVRPPPSSSTRRQGQARPADDDKIDGADARTTTSLPTPAALPRPGAPTGC